ncbi:MULTISPECIES: flagellar hook protein FlgE [unclassified Pseudomonas]|uniref:flagellar hook protein FlgE n=1 Tax=unclassified Pseudomonas TaxID=196821 RepID=UPI000D338960|nr:MULTISPECIES: flagellar hook protein FlgE [unclassified Pseudomonas]RAU39794.1 flagellar hook-basal body complex protein [Pseudomonas sp. RIT 409]RAU46008.1 flagellar hook-basal body complex protein [Pseudomonas sp. RIT 412]
MSFNIAVAGLNAAHKRMEVAGNNIANVGTTGFKSSRAEFSAVYSSSMLGSGNAVGDGVRLANVSQNFKAGGVMSDTGRALDMRIQGKGFFVMSDNGAISYGRSGAFLKDAENYIVDAQGSRLQGYAVTADGEVIRGVRTDLQIDNANLAPKATSKVEQTINLDSAEASLAAVPTFNVNDPRTWTRMTTQTIQDAGVPEVKEVKGKDAKGNEVIVVAARAAVPPQDHELTQYFVKLDDNNWTSYLLIDGVNPLDPSTTTPLEVGIRKLPNGNLHLTGNQAAVKLEKSGDLALYGWQPAIKVNGNWVPSPAANTGVVALPLNDASGALLNPGDPVMPRPVPAFDRADVSTYNKPFTSAVFDSLGVRHELTQYFVKDGSNSWKMHVLIDGRNPQDPESTDPLTASVLFNADGMMQTLTGGPGLVASNGKLTLSGWVPAKPVEGNKVGGRWGSNGATGDGGGIVLDMNKLSQFRAATGSSGVFVDGYAAGSANKLSIDKSGIMRVGYSNGQQRVIGQVMLASFANEQGLQPMSNTRWIETADSGVANYEEPGIGTLGSIVNQSLEGSNVDLQSELVELIQAQTAYQANSKTLSTEAELMQTLIRAT